MKEAMFYNRLSNGVAECVLCPHNCRIRKGERGLCGVRVNDEGILYAASYAVACAAGPDPIEKKPIFHMLPGTKTYSIATVGCNLSCIFCQNFEISQGVKESKEIYGRNIPPEKIVKEAIAKGCRSISYTYTEPTVFFEYAYDTAKLAHEVGFRNIFVSNGYIDKKPISIISPYLDAINIDLKSFSDEFYMKRCGAKLQPVLDAIIEYHRRGVHVEITTLLIPDENERSLVDIARFIASVDKKIPWHVSCFHPDYKMQDRRPTGKKEVENAIEIGRKAGLKYVYAGNIRGHPRESTYCPECGKAIIEREGYLIVRNNLHGGSCGACGAKADIIC